MREQITCPFIINNECDVPPCNSCYIYNCIYHVANLGKEGDNNDANKMR